MEQVPYPSTVILYNIYSENLGTALDDGSGHGAGVQSLHGDMGFYPGPGYVPIGYGVFLGCSYMMSSPGV